MDTTRVREVLGWHPRHSAVEAFCELLAGIADGAGADTAPLHPRRTATTRVEDRT
jgi:hypothetical protein